MSRSGSTMATGMISTTIALVLALKPGFGAPAPRLAFAPSFRQNVGYWPDQVRFLGISGDSRIWVEDASFVVDCASGAGRGQAVATQLSFLGSHGGHAFLGGSKVGQLNVIRGVVGSAKVSQLSSEARLHEIYRGIDAR